MQFLGRKKAYDLFDAGEDVIVVRRDGEEYEAIGRGDFYEDDGDKIVDVPHRYYLLQDLFDSNAAIADFIGKFEWLKKKERAKYIKSLHYHDDWRSLMEAVDKIEAEFSPVTIIGKVCAIGSLSSDHIGTGVTKIEAVFEVVSRFCKLVNSNKGD